MTFGRPWVMGILNVTPDSFSDGGRYAEPGPAIERGLQLVAEGADVLDIGGESTRPGATPVSEDEELRRVIPVVRGLAGQVKVPLSIDTMKASVARAALDAGAVIVNDVSGLRDPAMVEVCRDSQAGIVLMHMAGNPQTMQLNPHYDDIVAEIGTYFETRLADLEQHGIARDRIALDPGIGFGKSLDHTLTQLARLHEYCRFGRPICLGISRKGFLGQITGRDRTDRLAGTLAVNCFAVAQGAAQILRVHDVPAHRDAVRLWEGIQRFQ